MSEKTYSLEMTIRTLLGNKRYSSIKDILVTLNAADIAAIFAELEPEILPLLFRLLPKELAADTFVEMDPDQQQLLIMLLLSILASLVVMYLSRFINRKLHWSNR
ncbi:MAG: hypothetical protein IJI82_05375 [Clostridia bacterium]|nr:hypothetical protein [Clostridia bacterium]